MEFGSFFVGQRPLVHEQYADGQRVNLNPVSWRDAEVYHDILKGAKLAETLGFDAVWIAIDEQHWLYRGPGHGVPRPLCRRRASKSGGCCRPDRGLLPRPSRIPPLHDWYQRRTRDCLSRHVCGYTPLISTAP